MEFRSATILGLLGLVPFFFFTLCILYDPHNSMALMGFHQYAATVLAFLGGINWGLLAQGRSVGQSDPLKAYWVWSSLPPLVAFLILCLPATWASFVILASMYPIQYFLDVRLTKKSILPYWLLQLRRLLTLLVMPAFILILIRTW